MDEVYDTLERLKLLWRQLEHTKFNTSQYDVLVKIRAESDAYLALVAARTSQPNNP